MIDELAYIEREAREQGEAEYRLDMRMRGLCAECGGAGRHPNPYCTGDTAGGWADTCDTCNGTGRDLRGCEWCLITHPVQRCPAIRALLFDADPPAPEPPVIDQEGDIDRPRVEVTQ